MKRVKELFAIKADQNYWDDIRRNFLSNSSGNGANIKFKFTGGGEITAHQIVLERSTCFFQRNSGGDFCEQDPFGNFMVILPDVTLATMKKCLEMIYTGRTLTPTRGNIMSDVLWTMKEVFGFGEEDFTVDLSTGQRPDNDIEEMRLASDEVPNLEIDVDEEQLKEKSNAREESSREQENADSDTMVEPITESLEIRDSSRCGDSIGTDEEDSQIYIEQPPKSMNDFRSCQQQPSLQKEQEQSSQIKNGFKRPSNTVGCLEENQEFASWQECQDMIQNVTESLGMNIRVERSFKSKDNERFPVYMAEFACHAKGTTQHRLRTSNLCPFRINVELDKLRSRLKIKRIVNLHSCNNGQVPVMDESDQSAKSLENEIDMEDVSYDGKLVKDYKFYSYRSFLRVFQKYCYEKCIYFKIQVSQRTNKQNIDLTKFPFARIHFVCHYGGTYRSRSKGFRIAASSCVDCPFSLKLRLALRNEFYIIKSVNLEHSGHDLVPAYYGNHGKKIKKPFNLSEFPKENSRQDLAPAALKRLKKAIEDHEDNEDPHESDEDEVQLDESEHLRLKPGVVFKSYDEFHELFKDFCHKTKMKHRMISSTKSPKGICDERFPFSKLQFGCGRVGKRRPKVFQCPFNIKLVHFEDKGCLVITEATLKHRGHKPRLVQKDVDCLKEEVRDPLGEFECEEEFKDLLMMD